MIYETERREGVEITQPSRRRDPDATDTRVCLGRPTTPTPRAGRRGSRLLLGPPNPYRSTEPPGPSSRWRRSGPAGGRTSLPRSRCRRRYRACPALPRTAPQSAAPTRAPGGPRPPPLPMAQVQLSLMALCLLPDASFCSFRRISSILPSRRVAAGAQVQAAMEEMEEQRDAALGLSPKRPCLRGDGARHPAARLPPLMNHAELHGGDTSVVAAAESLLLLLLLPPRAGSCGAAGLGPRLAPPAAGRARRLRPRCSRWRGVFLRHRGERWRWQLPTAEQRNGAGEAAARLVAMTTGGPCPQDAGVPAACLRLRVGFAELKRESCRRPCPGRQPRARSRGARQPDLPSGVCSGLIDL